MAWLFLSIPALLVVTSVLPSSTVAPSVLTWSMTPAWATLIDAMSNAAAALYKLSGERVFIGNSLPTVPKAIVEQIHKWQYVDLADLLRAPSLHDQTA